MAEGKRKAKPKKEKAAGSSGDAFMASIGERVEREERTTALYCEHANERPQVCECPIGCYCKSHTCRAEGYVRGLSPEQVRRLRVEAAVSKLPFVPAERMSYADAARRDPVFNFFGDTR